jgi:hypothetical protein
VRRDVRVAISGGAGGASGDWEIDAMAAAGVGAGWGCVRIETAQRLAGCSRRGAEADAH